MNKKVNHCGFACERWRVTRAAKAGLGLANSPPWLSSPAPSGSVSGSCWQGNRAGWWCSVAGRLDGGVTADPKQTATGNVQLQWTVGNGDRLLAWMATWKSSDADGVKLHQRWRRRAVDRAVLGGVERDWGRAAGRLPEGGRGCVDSSKMLVYRRSQWWCSDDGKQRATTLSISNFISVSSLFCFFFCFAYVVG